MKFTVETIRIPRISKEAIVVRVAMAAAIFGAALASLVVGTPAVIISAGVIAASAAVYAML